MKNMKRTILSAQSVSIEKCKITFGSAAWTYDGVAFKLPKLTISYGKNKLVEGKDYVLNYSVKKSANSVTIQYRVFGLGNYYGKAMGNHIMWKNIPQTINSNSEYTLYLGVPLKMDVTTDGGGKLSFTSKSLAIAAVDAQGNIIPRKEGTATVTIKASANGKYAATTRNVKVTVQNKVPQAIVCNKSYTVPMGQSINLNAKATGGGKLTYTSKNESVATVDSAGKVYGKAKGTAVITIKASENGKYAAASKDVKVTVSDKPLTTNFDSVQLAGEGHSETLTASVAGAKFTSNNTKIATVNSSGKITGKNAGTATITVKAGSQTKNVSVRVFGMNSRENALAPWKHTLIDTFFYINDRKYSMSKPAKWWSTNGKWNGKTGASGSTQSCLTLPCISLQRMGLINKNKIIWMTSNMASKPNSYTRNLAKNSKKLTITFPNKSLKTLVAKGGVKYGDVVCRSGHIFTYMGGKYKIFNGGSLRDIGGGTRVVWGHSGGKTKKIKKQIAASNALGAKWRAGKISDSAFNGTGTSGKNVNSSIHIVCSINTFKVKTQCVNGSITPSAQYCAGQNIIISFSPNKGRKISSVTVDGKARSASGSYTFNDISAHHTIRVVYK